MNCYTEIAKNIPEFLSLAAAVRKDRVQKVSRTYFRR